MDRRKIAFVASGGAARGLAHLGVLKACEELGLVPDIFVGTSAGAIVGAMYGQDIPLDVLLDGYRLPWLRRHRGPRLNVRTFAALPTRAELFDIGHLCSGLFSIRKFEQYLRRYLPINNFDRISRPIFTTAVDIDTGQRHVFGPGYDTRATISEAVAASCCVPGLFRPLRINDQYFIDGEVARTLSLDLAIEAGANVVIISNVYRPVRKLNTKRSIARKGIQQVMRQSLSVLLTEKEQRGLQLTADRYPDVTFVDIAPDLGQFGYLNHLAARPLVMRSYGTALRSLAAAKQQHVFDHLLPPDDDPHTLNGAAE